MNPCPSCQAPLNPGSAFCTACGTPLTDQADVVCSGCGYLLQADVQFCTSCGVPRQSAESAPSAPAPPTFEPAPGGPQPTFTPHPGASQPTFTPPPGAEQPRFISPPGGAPPAFAAPDDATQRVYAPPPDLDQTVLVPSSGSPEGHSSGLFDPDAASPAVGTGAAAGVGVGAGPMEVRQPGSDRRNNLGPYILAGLFVAVLGGVGLWLAGQRLFDDDTGSAAGGPAPATPEAISGTASTSAVGTDDETIEDDAASSEPATSSDSTGETGTDSTSSSSSTSTTDTPVIVKVDPSTIQASASSSLAPIGDLTYGPENLLDDDITTAWNDDTGEDRDGVGQTLTFRFADPVDLARIDMVNGYAKNDEVFARNEVPAEIVVATDTGVTDRVDLARTPTVQSIPLTADGVTTVTITIEAIHPALAYEGEPPYTDLAITELSFFASRG